MLLVASPGRQKPCLQVRTWLPLGLPMSSTALTALSAKGTNLFSDQHDGHPIKHTLVSTQAHHHPGAAAGIAYHHDVWRVMLWRSPIHSAARPLLKQACLFFAS